MMLSSGSLETGTGSSNSLRSANESWALQILCIDDSAQHREKLPRKHYGPAVLIFQWAGRRKSEPSDLPNRSEPAPINSGPATTLLLFKVKRQVHLQAESTAKSANGEESPKLASEPRRGQFSGGPWVPDSGQMRVFRAAKQRIPKTEDSLAERGEFELSGDFIGGQ